MERVRLERRVDADVEWPRSAVLGAGPAQRSRDVTWGRVSAAHRSLSACLSRVVVRAIRVFRSDALDGVPHVNRRKHHVRRHPERPPTWAVSLFAEIPDPKLSPQSEFPIPLFPN